MRLKEIYRALLHQALPKVPSGQVFPTGPEGLAGAFHLDHTPLQVLPRQGERPQTSRCHAAQVQRSRTLLRRRKVFAVVTKLECGANSTGRAPRSAHKRLHVDNDTWPVKTHHVETHLMRRATAAPPKSAFGSYKTTLLHELLGVNDVLSGLLGGNKVPANVLQPAKADTTHLALRSLALSFQLPHQGGQVQLLSLCNRPCSRPFLPSIDSSALSFGILGLVVTARLKRWRHQHAGRGTMSSHSASVKHAKNQIAEACVCTLLSS